MLARQAGSQTLVGGKDVQMLDTKKVAPEDPICLRKWCPDALALANILKLKLPRSTLYIVLRWLPSGHVYCLKQPLANST